MNELFSQDLFTPASLSVSELNTIAKQLLESQLTGLWINGEISNLTRASSGHYYFILKDPHAQVRCTLFRPIAAKLATPLKDGDHIELTGKIGLYEARGEFQINVQNLRTLGLGDHYYRYEQLKNTLQNEGLFSPERKKKLPEYPKRIGIITSLAAAALRDVLTTLHRRAPHLPIIIYPTPVQGTGSEQHIAAALRTANQRAETDVLIICRGGGSIEDLWAFNEEIVARSIADSRIPIISGVGHETDFTLADFAADVRAPTPTAAAELVSIHLDNIQHHIKQLHHTIHQQIQQRHQNASQQLDLISQQLRHPQQQIHQNQHHLHHLHQQLQHHIQQIIHHHRQKCQHQTALLNALSPENILQRGYTIVQNTRGKIIYDAKRLKMGQKLTIVFADRPVQVQIVDQINGELFE